MFFSWVFNYNPFFSTELLQWRVIYNGLPVALPIFADSTGVAWCECPRLGFRLCWGPPSSHSPRALVSLHWLVPISSHCSWHFVSTLIAFAYSVSPSLLFRISRTSLLIQPILSLFFFLLLFPLPHTIHSNTHFTPIVPGPSLWFLIWPTSFLPPSYLSFFTSSPGQTRCDLYISIGQFSSSDREWNLGFMPHKIVV